LVLRGTFFRTTWNGGQSCWGISPLTKWWPTCSPNHYRDLHLQDIEVRSGEEKIQCNASSRSNLQGECCN
jgi:hypothetical protein